MSTNNNDAFGPMGSSSLFMEESAQKTAEEELNQTIEYSVFICKVKGEDQPRSFDLNASPDVRNKILSLIIDSHE